MVFGFGKKETAARDAEHYVRTAFAGLPTIPNQAFGDPYVVAFLQVLTLHATAIVYKGSMPDQMTVAAIMAKALDGIVPGYGLQIVKGAVAIAQPGHQLNQNFQVGRRDGNEYVAALNSNDTLILNEKLHAFREFVTRNYS